MREVYIPGQAEPVHVPDDMSDEDVVKFLSTQGGATPPEAPPSNVAGGYVAGTEPKPAPAPMAAPAQYTGNRFLRAAGITGQAAMKGLTEAAGLPGTASGLVQAGMGAVGVPQGVARLVAPLLPGMGSVTGHDIQQMVTDPLGLTNSPSLTPSNTVERLGAGVTSAGVSALASGPFMGVKALPALMSGVGSGGASSAVDALAPGHPVVSALAGVLGGLLPAGMVACGNLTNNIAKLKETLEDSWLATKGEQRVADVIRDQANSTFRDAKAGAIQAHSDAGVAAAAEHQDMMNRASTLQDAIRGGDPLTLQEAGQAAQDAARRWLGGAAARDAERFAPISEAIGGDHPTPLTNFTAYLDENAGRGGELKPLLDQVTSPLPRNLQATIASTRHSPEDIARAEANNETLPPVLGENGTWENANALRQAVGSLLADPSLRPKGTDEAGLRAMYGALRQDMGAAASAAGQGQAYEAAMNAAEAEHQFVEQHVSKLIGTSRDVQDHVAPEKAASALIAEGKKGATSLTALRQQIPDAVDPLAQHLLSPGEGPMGAQWATLSPEARSALIPTDAMRTGADTVSASAANADAQLAQRLARAKADKNFALADAGRTRINTLADRENNAGLRDLQDQFTKQDLAELQARQKTPMEGIERAILGGIIGGGFPGAGFGLQHLGLHFGPEITGPGMAIGALLGAGAPAAGRYGALIARDPEALRVLGQAGLLGGQRGVVSAQQGSQ